MRLWMLLFVCLALSGGRAMAIEEPASTVVVQQGPFSVRDYQPMVVAEVATDGDQEQAVGRGFRILAGYIFSGNQRRQKIAMTAPVTQQPAGDASLVDSPVAVLGAADHWIVRFTMPRGQTLQTLPPPNDPRVRLRLVQAQRVAVLRFSGWAGPSDFVAKAAELLRIAQAHHLRLIGPVTLAQYNPPWTLWFMRRNEVMAAVATLGDAG